MTIACSYCKLFPALLQHKLFIIFYFIFSKRSKSTFTVSIFPSGTSIGAHEKSFIPIICLTCFVEKGIKGSNRLAILIMLYTQLYKIA